MAAPLDGKSAAAARTMHQDGDTTLSTRYSLWSELDLSIDMIAALDDLLRAAEDLPLSRGSGAASTRVVIRGDQTATYELIMKVISKAREAGLTDVALASRSRQ